MKEEVMKMVMKKVMKKEMKEGSSEVCKRTHIGCSISCMIEGEYKQLSHVLFSRTCVC